MRLVNLKIPCGLPQGVSVPFVSGHFYPAFRIPFVSEIYLSFQITCGFCFIKNVSLSRIATEFITRKIPRPSRLWLGTISIIEFVIIVPATINTRILTIARCPRLGDTYWLKICCIVSMRKTYVTVTSWLTDSNRGAKQIECTTFVATVHPSIRNNK